MFIHLLLPTIKFRQTEGESTVQSLFLSKHIALYLPSSCFSLSPSILLLAVVPGPFRMTCLAPDLWTSGAKRHRSQRVKTGSCLSSSRLLISASSAGVCHPLLSQTDVCLPVYCSWPGRLVGVQASALSLTLWNTTAVRLLPDSMLIVWFNSPMFNHEEKWREREGERERDYDNWLKVLLCWIPSVHF